MQSAWRTAGSPAFRVFVLTRTAIWTLAAGTVLLFDSVAPDGLDTARLHDLGAAIDVWARWDSDWYLLIAEGGYDWPSGSPAFLPLYPALVGGMGRLLGGHYVLAGVVVSTVACGAGFILLHRLVRERCGDEIATRSVLYLALFPTSLFLTAVYSESLFLVLAIATFVLAERGRLGWAAGVAGLALLTRSQGLALLPALAVFGWRSPAPWRSAALLLVPLAIFAAYPVALWATLGRPLAFLEAQGMAWDRAFDPLALVTGVPAGVAEGHVVEVASATLMLPLAVVAWRALGAAYGSYAAVALLLPMAFPSATFGALYSFPRLCIVAFPCFIALALLTRDWRIHAAIIGAFSIGLAVLVVRWALWHWVA